MKKIPPFFVFATACLILSGCASIMDGGPQMRTLRSDPDGARVVITNGEGTSVFKGETPTAVPLDRYADYFSGHRYVVEFTKSGYLARKVELEPEINGWYWANIIFGGLIGMVGVDPATGAMWTYNQEKLHVKLDSEEGVTAKAVPLQTSTPLAAAGDMCKAGPSWTPNSRYLINNDEVVDQKTGLLWKRCLEGMKWNGNTCTGYSEDYNASDISRKFSGNKNGWRLPTIDELNSLRSGKDSSDTIPASIDQPGLGCTDPALNTAAFPGPQDRPTASSSIASSDVLRGIDFEKGKVIDLSLSTNRAYATTLISARVRLVKGNPSAGLIKTGLHKETIK